MAVVILAATEPFSFATIPFDPILILAIYFAGLAYHVATGSRRLRWFPNSSPVERRQRVYFYSGLAVATVSLLWPMGILADDYLLSIHMLQHVLITIIMPILLFAGIPVWIYDRIPTDHIAWRIWRALTMPILAFMLFQIPFAASHIPAFYDVTLENKTVHIIEHWWFITTSMIIWWPIMAPSRQLGKVHPLLQMTFLFFQTIPGQLVGALIVFADGPLYRPYEVAPRTFGLSVMIDQQLGGLAMWVGTGTLYVAALSYIFFRWMRESGGSAQWTGAVERHEPRDAGESQAGRQW